MKKQSDPAKEKSTVIEPQLAFDEKQKLLAVLATARENVKPTVKRLMESESVSDILSMRLDNVAFTRSQHASSST